jgi:hypothetical protein
MSRVDLADAAADLLAGFSVIATAAGDQPCVCKACLLLPPPSASVAFNCWWELAGRFCPVTR